MKVVVGLGNPGKLYSNTRHNIGFDIVDVLAQQHGVTKFSSKFKSHMAEVYIGGKKTILLKPQTYMNLSGEAVMAVRDYYDLLPSDFIVICDEAELPVGKIRIRAKGSAGGQNGMKNIIYHLENDEFPRLRVGIGRPTHGKLSDYVLSKFSTDELPYMQDVLKNSTEAIEMIVKDNILEAMNKFN